MPTTLSPDGRSRPPHLRTWRDGWRHLRFLLVFAPRKVLVWPGVVLSMLGLVSTAALTAGPVSLGTVTFDIGALVYACLALLVGVQLILSGGCAKIYGAFEGLVGDRQLAAWMKLLRFEVCVAVGLLLIVGGGVGTAIGVGEWGQAGFGDLNPSHTLRIVVPSATAIALGAIIIFAGLLASLLTLRGAPSRSTGHVKLSVRSGGGRPPRSMTRDPAVACQKAGRTSGTGRLNFLDVLRGVSAMSVVLYHLGNHDPVKTEGFYWASHTVLNLGGFGVLAFFLISGFIIPASLERHGSLLEFWVGRVFRLGPLFWAISIAALVLGIVGAMPVRPNVYSNWPGALLGNLTLLSRHLGSPFLIGPAWTLPYELCFYMLITWLFASRFRQAGAAVALLVAGLTLGATDAIVGRAAVTPWVLHIDGYHGNPLRVLALTLLLAGAGAVLARGRTNAIYAVVVSIGVVPVLLNRPDPLYQAGIYLTVMFAGTVVHRIWAGQISARVGWTVYVTAAAASIGTLWLHSETWYSADGQLGESPLTRSIAITAAFGTFAAILLVGDRVSWPRLLLWLGRISYSIYLSHWVVMLTVPTLPASVPFFRVLTVLTWIATTLAVSATTYRFIEQPSIDLGRRIIKTLRARTQSATEPTQPAHVSKQPPEAGDRDTESAAMTSQTKAITKAITKPSTPPLR